MVKHGESCPSNELEDDGETVRCNRSYSSYDAVESNLRYEVNSLREDLQDKEAEIASLLVELQVSKDYLEESEHNLGQCRQLLQQSKADLSTAKDIIARSDEKKHCMALHDQVTNISNVLEAEKSRNRELNKKISEVKDLASKRILHQSLRVESAKSEVAQLSLELHHAMLREESSRQRFIQLQHAVSLSVRSSNICIETCQDILGHDSDGVGSRDARRLFRELSRLRRSIFQQSI